MVMSRRRATNFLRKGRATGKCRTAMITTTAATTEDTTVASTASTMDNREEPLHVDLSAIVYVVPLNTVQRMAHQPTTLPRINPILDVQALLSFMNHILLRPSHR